MAFYLNYRALDKRFDLLCRLFEVPESMQLSNNGLSNQIGNSTTNSDAIVKDLYDKYKNKTIPLDELKWIKDDLISLWFIHSNLNFINVIPAYKLEPKDQAIFYIDAAIYNGFATRESISNIKNAFEIIEGRSKKYLWVDVNENNEIIELFVEYIKKHFSINLMFPIDCYLDSIKTSLHLEMVFMMLNVHDADRKLCVIYVKKRLSQNKYRRNLIDKKQCNIVIAKDSLKILEKIAYKYMTSRSNIIDILIRKEDEKKLYLEEWKKFNSISDSGSNEEKK